MTTPIDHLTEIEACDPARRWVAEGKFPDLEAAWLACENPDWLLWYAGRKAGPIGEPKRQVLVTIACECARLVLDIFEKLYPDDKRPRKAIETAEAWVAGKASMEEVFEARNAAYTVEGTFSARAAARAAAYTAAYAAADAYAAAAYAYDAAADAYAAAAYAYDADAAAYARDQMRARCVEIIKKHYPTLPV